MITIDGLLAAGAAVVHVGAVQQWPNIAYDSRLARPGELFVALQTERADGHAFINDALAAGVAGVLCVEAPVQADPSVTILTTPDVLQTLSRWASGQVAQCGPTIVAVTGSVGKTSTKRAIATVLAGDAPVFSSPHSFNTALGLSVSLAALEAEQRWAVLEFGADRRGEIAQLATLFPPKVGVVTAVGAAHLDTLGSLEHVAEEKGALVRALPSEGWAILNGDDPHVRALAQTTRAWVMTYGSGSHCDLWYQNVELSVDGTRFELHGHSDGAPPTGATMTRERSWFVSVNLPTLGLAGVRAALAAVATALACAIPLETALARLGSITQVAGRLRPLMTVSGATLIDDSFNAAPPSMLNALDTLAALPARRRIAILGEMSHLGSSSAHYHERIGAAAAEVVDVLITKGDQATKIAHAARLAAQNSGRSLEVTRVYTAAAAIQALPTDLGPDDLVLVKGSPESRMERVVAGLLAPDVPPDAVLVRQERAWRHVRVGTPDRPTTLRIDLDALAFNTARLRELVGVQVMAVLKADAYGHGAIRAARTVLLNGAAWLGVATLGEALNLRAADIAAPILILGYTPPWQALEAVRQGIACTVFDLATANALSAAAVQLGRSALVHVKVDTGMTRLGLPPADVVVFAQMLADLPNVDVLGVFTHFATGDDLDQTYVHTQLARFQQCVGDLEQAGLRPPLVHAANSAAALRYPEARFDLVRLGISLYGLDPAPEAPLPDDLRPVMSFHTEIAQVRDIPAGTPVSYGCRFVAERPSRIATIPVGYADGFRRAPNPWKEVLVGGVRAPVVGRVCMDYAMIDVTDCPPTRRGDPVVLIGAQAHDRISAEEVAEWLGTNTYEVAAAILPRVPRESTEEG